MTKSNPISDQWMTHKLENNCTTEALLQERKFSPAWESGNGRRSPQRIQLDRRNFMGLGETNSTLGRHTRSCARQELGKRSSDLIRHWARPICQYWRVSCTGRAWLQLTADKDTGGGSSVDYSLAGALLKVAISSPTPGPTQQPVAPVLGYLRLNNQQAGNTALPTADRLLKAILSTCCCCCCCDPIDGSIAAH